MRTVVVAALLLASAFTAQAKISINGPEQAGTAKDRVINILSIDLAGR